MKYDINKILDLLPHRYPFLLVDRIEDLVLTDDLIEVTGIKNVSINEPFFQGHFPDEPVMPGVLVIEAMGQVAAVLLTGRPAQDCGDSAQAQRQQLQVQIQGNNRWGSCGRRNYGLRGILRAYT